MAAADRTRIEEANHALGRPAGKQQRRGSSRRQAAAAAAVGGGFRGGAGGLAIGTVVVLGLIGWALGIDPSLLIGGAEMLNAPAAAAATAAAVAATPGRAAGRDGPLRRAASSAAPRCSGRRSSRKDGKPLSRAGAGALLAARPTRSCGGVAQSAMGPFYCPADKKIYLDTSFFQIRSRRAFAAATSAARPASSPRPM